MTHPTLLIRNDLPLPLVHPIDRWAKDYTIPLLLLLQIYLCPVVFFSTVMPVCQLTLLSVLPALIFRAVVFHVHTESPVHLLRQFSLSPALVSSTALNLPTIYPTLTARTADLSY